MPCFPGVSELLRQHKGIKHSDCTLESGSDGRIWDGQRGFTEEECVKDLRGKNRLGTVLGHCLKLTVILTPQYCRREEKRREKGEEK